MNCIKTIATENEPTAQRLRLAHENGGFININGDLVRIVWIEERPNGWTVVDVEGAAYVEGR